MGLVRLDGYTRSSSSNGNSPVSSSSYTPSTPTRPKTFQEALDQAQTASDAAAGSKDPKVITTAAIDWGIVQAMEENEYRLAATSSDPAGQMAALDAKYGKLFRGHGGQTEFYDSTWKQAKATVQKESPAERQYQIQFYNAQTKVQDTYKALQSASTDTEKSAAYTAYSGAVRDQINLQLNHALTGMPAGPGGSHTLEQWKQAAQKVKEEAGATDPNSAQVIDSIALVSGYVGPDRTQSGGPQAHADRAGARQEGSGDPGLRQGRRGYARSRRSRPQSADEGSGQARSRDVRDAQGR